MEIGPSEAEPFMRSSCGGSPGGACGASSWVIADVTDGCFGRLKEFRRIATRYHKLAGNVFSALCLVAIVSYWL